MLHLKINNVHHGRAGELFRVEKCFHFFLEQKHKAYFMLQKRESEQNFHFKNIFVQIIKLAQNVVVSKFLFCCRAQFL
jgi:hypothetical protein